jgi:hypothetical protein
MNSTNGLLGEWRDAHTKAGYRIQQLPLIAGLARPTGALNPQLISK